MNQVKNRVTLREVMRIVLPIVVSSFALLGLLKCLDAAGLLPAPSVSTHPDLTILIHQDLAGSSHDSAKIILVGDSTCLMGVDAQALSQMLPHQTRVLSLALVIWLDLRVYGEVLSNFARANPGQVRAVVLLVSPAKLENGGQPDQGPETDFWRQVRFAGRGIGVQETGTPIDRLGIKLLRENVFSHLLDTPIRSQGEATFGFSSQIDAYMTAHQGSLMEPGTFLIPRRRETAQWNLSPAFEAETRAFRAMVPADAKLFIGLTPIAKITSSPGDRERRDNLLREWNRIMNADGLLTNLPVTLPNVYFSATGHLNELGQKKYTACLQQNLASSLKNELGVEPEASFNDGAKRSVR